MKPGHNVELWNRLELACRAGGPCLGEDIGFEVLDALGFDTPARLFVDGPDALADVNFSIFPGDDLILKPLCAGLSHKTEVGGVLRVPKDRDALGEAMRSMRSRIDSALKLRYALYERVICDEAPGSSFLMGLRFTRDFGPLLVLGMGGIYSEFWASHLKEEVGLSFFSLPFEGNTAERFSLERNAAVKLGTQVFRGRPALLSIASLVDALQRFSRLAAWMPNGLLECEINPLVAVQGRLRPLDVRMIPGRLSIKKAATKDISKLNALLMPKSIAIAGVSERMNPGHIILLNLLEDAFDRDKIFVIKPGIEAMEGVKAVPSPEALPQCVDVLVAGLSAIHTPALLRSCMDHQKARCVVLISGGLEEKEGGQKIADELVSMLESARAEGKDSPLVLGGNCLGFRSLPARCDTIFIPRFKLPLPCSSSDTLSSMALLSQSGAFAIARLSKFLYLHPRYLITLGNQMDISAGDMLNALKDDPAVKTVAVYVEGFKDGDGLHFLNAARSITQSGRSVILYRGGQNAQGAKAALSHTARISGEMRVMAGLLEQAGVLVCESIEDFEDLCSLFWCLESCVVEGNGLGVVSNAGFECVASADFSRDLRLVDFGPETQAKVAKAFRALHLDSIVDMHNPLDLTPMCDDAGYEACVRAVLEDSAVHVGIVGCVPLTPALNTLEAAQGHAEDIVSEQSVVQRLTGLWRAPHEGPKKAWVAVVDAGSLYDAMADKLKAAGICVFRHSDRASRLLGRYVGERLRVQAIKG